MAKCDPRPLGVVVAHRPQAEHSVQLRDGRVVPCLLRQIIPRALAWMEIEASLRFFLNSAARRLSRRRFAYLARPSWPRRIAWSAVMVWCFSISSRTASWNFFRFSRSRRTR